MYPKYFRIEFFFFLSVGELNNSPRAHQFILETGIGTPLA